MCKRSRAILSFACVTIDGPNKERTMIFSFEKNRENHKERSPRLNCFQMVRSNDFIAMNDRFRSDCETERGIRIDERLLILLQNDYLIISCNSRCGVRFGAVAGAELMADFDRGRVIYQAILTKLSLGARNCARTVVFSRSAAGTPLFGATNSIRLLNNV